MSLTQSFYLAHSARRLLAKEAAKADHDLRRLVGHANLPRQSHDRHCRRRARARELVQSISLGRRQGGRAQACRSMGRKRLQSPPLRMNQTRRKNGTVTALMMILTRRRSIMLNQFHFADHAPTPATKVETEDEDMEDDEEDDDDLVLTRSSFYTTSRAHARRLRFIRRRANASFASSSQNPHQFILGKGTASHCNDIILRTTVFLGYIRTGIVLRRRVLSTTKTVNGRCRLRIRRFERLLLRLSLS